jgi:hypothetical protein
MPCEDGLMAEQPARPGAHSSGAAQVQSQGCRALLALASPSASARIKVLHPRPSRPCSPRVRLVRGEGRGVSPLYGGGGGGP